MKLELRKATIEDCKDIYRWRTDPINSEGSFTGGSFTYDDHAIWFKGYLGNADNLMLIASFNSKSCCVLRFDKEWDHHTLIKKFPHRVQKSRQREFDTPFDPEK